MKDKMQLQEWQRRLAERATVLTDFLTYFSNIKNTASRLFGFVVRVSYE